MSLPSDAQQLESYVPVYDAIPEKWEQAQPFLVEQLKKISNAVNAREIGFWLDEELLSGKQFFPGASNAASSQVFRSMLRKVIDFSPLTGGAKTLPHGILFNSDFSLIQLFAAATNSVTLVAEPIPNGADTITMDATNITITTAGSYDRCYCTVEYMQEL